MTCSTSTAPVNLTRASVKGPCDLKCAFQFHYGPSSCVVTHRAAYLSVAHDASSSPPVTFNGTGYDLQEARLYRPSLHTFGGKHTDAEWILRHVSPTGAPSLLVCLPVQSRSATSASSLFLERLVTDVAQQAPAEGDRMTLSLPSFSWSSLVPAKPFYSYTATEPYAPCDQTVQYVVFDPVQGGLDIFPTTLATLESVIQAQTQPIRSGASVFWNAKGALNRAVGTGSDVYMDCRPVGQSEETTEVVRVLSTSPSWTWRQASQMPVVQGVGGFLLAVLVLGGIGWGLRFLVTVSSEDEIEVDK
jgi:carbonic anhydrase